MSEAGGNRRITLSPRSWFAAWKGSFEGLPRAAYVLALAAFVDRAGSMVLPFMNLYLTTQKGYPPESAANFLSVYGIVAVFASLAGGWMVDRWPPARIQVLSLLGSAALYQWVGRADSDLSLGLSLGVLAFSSQVFRPANAMAFTNVVPPELRTRALGLNRLAINLGMSVGPLIGGFLAERSYRMIFVVDGLTCVAAAMILFLHFSPFRSRAVPAAARISVPLRSILQDRVLVLTYLAVLLTAVVFFQWETTLLYFMKTEGGFRESTLGSFTTINTLIIVLGEMAVVRACERRSLLRIAGVGTIAIGLAFPFLLFGANYAAGLATLLFLTVGEILTAPILSGFVAGRAPNAARGRALGLYVLSWSTAYAIAPQVGMRVYARFGPEAVWCACAGIAAVAWILTMAARRAYEREKAAAELTSPSGVG